MYKPLLRLVGFVLVAAGALKAAGALGAPSPGGDLWESQWLTALVAGFEIALGAGLLAGLGGRAVRRLTVGCFILFFCVSLDKALAGEASCGCFGRLTVPPWLTAILDGGLFLALTTLKPPSRPGEDRPARGLGFSALRASALLAALTLSVLVGRTMLSRWRGGEDVPASLLAASASNIDFRRVPQAGRTEQVIWLRNPGVEAVAVSRVQTSCECLQVDLRGQSITPGDRRKAVVRLDLTREPLFTGKLRLQATGYTHSNAVAFSILVHVEVVRE